MLGLGIIGCGEHARHHAEHCGRFAIPMGVWDPIPAAMAKLGHVPMFPTIEALLVDPSIEAVIIGSPEEFHLEQTRMALEAGKHVFCEKPLLVPGQGIGELEALFDLAKSNGLVLTSCHPRRFDRPFMWFKHKFLEHKGTSFELGRPVSLDFDFSYHKPSMKWKHERSLLLDHINHEVDLMNFFFGISGFAAWRLKDGFDEYEVSGKREDGITFHFHGTRRLDSGVYPEWCRVRFEQGEVTMDMMADRAVVMDHESGTAMSTPKLGIDYGGRLDRVMDAFVRQIQGDGKAYLTPSEMLMNTEAAIVLSSQAGIQRIWVR